MQVESDIPLCETCGHHHEQGCRCPKCGHVGKSQLFAKMRLKADEKRSFRVEQFTANNDNADFLELVREVRSLYPSQSDVDAIEACDYQSHHLLAYEGDMLVGTVRYKWLHAENNIPTASILDQLIIHPQYQRRHYAWKLLLFFLQLYVSNNATSQDLYILLPNQNSWIISSCLNQGFQQQQESPDNNILSFDKTQCTLLHLKSFFPDLIRYIELKITNETCCK